MSKLAKALTAAAGNAAGESLYVEDVFSTYLYTGTGSTQSINNGIDLDGEGGTVLLQSRSNDTGTAWNVYDTERGVRKYLRSNSFSAESTAGTGAGLTSFNSNGFTLGTSWNTENFSPYTYVSWTFRKAEKFFDVVTYTGNGVSGGREISHNLGSSPGFILIKRTDTQTIYSSWISYHRAGSATGTVAFLSPTNFFFANGGSWFGDGSSAVAPTDTVFTINGGNNTYLNTSGATYIVYLFAHDAGGFGDDGSESIIKCGSYTGTGASMTQVEVDLGFEPQWLLLKSATAADDWYLLDNMRPWSVNSSAYAAPLYPNTSDKEYAPGVGGPKITSTGFVTYGGNGWSDNGEMIYIAIRRPMKTPESGTEVFAVGTNQEVPSATSGFYSGFPVDMAIKRIITASQPNYLFDRLRGANALVTNTTAAESGFGAAQFYHQQGWYYDNDSANTNDYSWMFKRATGFFDVVAYTGDGTSNRSINHNLGVTPELIIGKIRSGQTDYWGVWQASLGNQGMYLSAINSAGTTLVAEGHTSSIFKVSNGYGINNVSTLPHIAYLFGSVAGVSKVGSYTGTGSNVDVDCGFSAGARFILIKRTDSSSQWYLWDSKRGIVAGNDPWINLDTNNAQNSGQDAIDPLASGFTVTAAADVNQSGGTYIFLAIA